MKRWLQLLRPLASVAACGVCVCGGQAQSVVGTQPFAAASGASVEAPVYLGNRGEAVAIQFDLDSALGSISGIVADGSALEGHQVDSEIVEGGKLRVFIFSDSNESLSSGSLVTVSLTLDQAVAESDVALQVDDVILSDVAPAELATTNFGFVFEPQSVLVERGQSVELTALAVGPGPIEYQWLKDGTPVPGATGPSLFIDAATSADAGGYSARITSPLGSVSSEEAALALATDFPGFYFGSLSGAAPDGDFALFVTESSQAFVGGFLPSLGQGFVGETALDEAGGFSVEVPLDGGDPEETVVVEGQIDGEQAAGTISGGIEFAAQKSASGGVSAPIAGAYESHLLLTPDGDLFVFADEAGEAFVLARRAGAVAGGMAAVGEAALAGGFGDALDLDLAFDKDSGIVAGAATFDGEEREVRGLRHDIPSNARLVNISTRAQILAGARIMIAGFVVTGPGQKDILVRALGPDLEMRDVSGFNPDPRLSVFKGPNPIGVDNDNWQDADPQTLVEVFDRVGAPEPDDGSADAAALSAFASGPFTMLASGVGEATGIGLVEVFDADSLDADTVLANISTRAEVGTGENIVIAGFVIDGNGPVRVLVRGVGRELERISGGTLSAGELLQDPRLSLVNASGQIVATVDDWATQPEADLLAAAAQQVGAFALLDDDKSAVMMAWLRPGLYTALLSGVGGGTGIALVEVYHVFDEN